MADNVAITGATVATDDVGGVQYQRVKLDGGGDGATLPLIATALPPISTAVALPTREVGQDIWTVGFSATQSTIDTAMVELALGSGVGRSQANSNLLLTSGTTANAEYLARSAISFTGSVLARYRTQINQRIINNNFSYILADRVGEGLSYTNTTTTLTITQAGHGFTAANVGQSIFVGGITVTSGTAVPGRYAIASITDANTFVMTVTGWAAGAGTLALFGRSYVRLTYSGAVTTSAFFDCGNKGWSDGTIVTAVTNTTNSVGNQSQVHIDGRNAYLSDMLVASTTTPNVTVRASRTEFLPDDTQPLYLYLWLANGSTAPASSTTWTSGSITVETFANMPVYVAGQRQQGTAAPAPVAVVGNVATTAGTSALLMGDVGVQYRATATGASTIRHVVAAASTNSTLVKAAAGRVLGWQFANTSASFKYVRLHNSATAPTAGAGVVMTIALPPNANISFGCEGGIGFATGIGLTITGAAADADTTVVAANDVIGDLFYA